MALAYGSYFSGFIARSSLVGGSVSSGKHYCHFFFNLGLMPLGVICLLFVVVSLKNICLVKEKIKISGGGS
jgi:hypothetical membrane protein